MRVGAKQTVRFFIDLGASVTVGESAIVGVRALEALEGKADAAAAGDLDRDLAIAALEAKLDALADLINNLPGSQGGGQGNGPP